MNDHIDEIFGHCKLKRLIGRGGSSEVYYAEHEDDADWKVAIKLLLDNAVELSTSNEAKTIRNLRHPHIISVLGFGKENNIPYLVMDYADKGSLQKLNGQRVPLDTVVTYVKQIAEALAHAHKQGVIHCDIKPANILLDANDEIKLCDFGIAVIAPHTGDHRTVPQVPPIGTAAYMAPEQINGQPQFASDQYALGIVIYEWLCGKCPFQGSNMIVLKQHLETPPPSLHEENSEIPLALEAVIHKALQKDPQQRFKKIGDFAKAVEEAAKKDSPSQPVSVHSNPQGSPQQQIVLPGPSSQAISPNPTSKTAAFSSDRRYLNAPPADASPIKPVPPATPKVSRRLILAIAGVLLAGAGVQIVPKALDKFSGSKPAPLLTPQSTPSLRPQGRGKTSLVYSGQSGSITNVAWSPDGTYIVSASLGYSAPSYLDHPQYLAQIWNASTGVLAHILPHNSPVLDVAWSPAINSNVSFVVSCANNDVYMWDINNGQRIPILDENHQPANMSHHLPDSRKRGVVNALAWSISQDRNYLWLATAGDSGAIYFWQYTHETNTWQKSWQSITTFFLNSSENILDVAWSFDQNERVIALYSTTASYPYSATNSYTKVWVVNLDDTDATNPPKNFYEGSSGVSSSIAWTPNSGLNNLAFGTKNKISAVKEWNYDTHTYLSQIFSGYFTQPDIQIAWSHDGKYLAAGPWKSGVAIWDTTNNKSTFPLYIYQSDQKTIDITALAWSPKDYRIAAGTRDGEVHVWQGI